jgi:hypothetical protein
MGDTRPEIRCLVLKPTPDGQDVFVGKLGLVLLNGEREAGACIVSLETAPMFAALGWHIFVDPADEAVLARWMQINSPRQPWNHW